ncbi:MAG: flagellar protein FlaG [Desulfobacteraceae bacterium Eth-SRB1]|nr:MAG: flagellar protein FlaG [Desulfobacteraceae bacterium Eth-SRB1]
MIVENVKIFNDVLRELPETNRKYEEKPLEKAVADDNPLNKREIKHLVEEVQNCLDKININLKFSTYGEDNERTSVTVTEKKTGKMIREIPPAELQQLYLKMDELVGMFFNRTV